MPVSDEQLRHLLDCVNTLERALHAESAALRERDVDALLEAVATKRAALGIVTATLQQSGMSRLLELAAAGKDPSAGESGIVAAIIGKLRSCRELNESAGGAIAGLLQGARNALDLLGVPSRAPSYDTSGHNPASLPDRRTLAVC